MTKIKQVQTPLIDNINFILIMLFVVPVFVFAGTAFISALGGRDFPYVLFFILLGFCYWGVHFAWKQLLTTMRFGPATATVAPELIQRGTEVEVCFRQEFKQNTEVRFIHIHLVFCEHVDYRDEDGDSAKGKFERLVDSVTVPGRNYGPLFPVIVQAKLCVPHRALYFRNPFADRMSNSEKQWRIVVHLETDGPESKQNDRYWNTFDLEVDDRFAVEGSSDVDGVFYDVFLDGHKPIYQRNSVKPVPREVLPFLKPFDRAYMDPKPRLLVERVPLEKAKFAKQALDEAGFTSHIELTRGI